MAENNDPASFHFEVRIAGSEFAAGAAADASFEEASGIAVDKETTDAGEGEENKFVHRVPTPSHPANLVLKRGVIKASSALAQWTTEITQDGLSTPIKTQPLVVALVDQAGSLLASWTFRDAYPVKWIVAAFDAKDTDIAVEAVEFAYRSSERNAGQ